MSNNPVSFRVAFESQIAKLPPEHQTVIRTQMNAITDLQGAIPALKTQIDTINKTITSSSSSSASGTAAAVAAAQAAVAAAISGLPTSGRVNNQTGNSSYTTQNSDYGALILCNDSSPIGVGLNNSVSQPWYAWIENDGTSVVTVTPQQGLINFDSNITLTNSEWATVFFDGSNYWALISEPAVSGVTQILSGTGISVSPSSGKGVVTISATGSGSSYSLGGALTSANVSLGTGAGTGATFSITGLDGNHQITVTTGESPVSTGTVYTVTFTTSRGHVTYPLIQCPTVTATHAHIDLASIGGSATQYSAATRDTNLDASTTYIWNVTAP